MNRNIFCSRKGGANIKGKFHPMPTVSMILANQAERMANKLAIRAYKRETR